jgi:hypothetical protein
VSGVSILLTTAGANPLDSPPKLIGISSMIFKDNVSHSSLGVEVVAEINKQYPMEIIYRISNFDDLGVTPICVTPCVNLYDFHNSIMMEADFTFVKDIDSSVNIFWIFVLFFSFIMCFFIFCCGCYKESSIIQDEVIEE